MKKFIVLAFALLAVFALIFISDQDSGYIISNDEYSLKIASGMTQAELEYASVQFENIGINIDFSKSEFYNSGKIKSLDLDITYNENWKNDTPEPNMEIYASQVALLVGSYGFRFEFGAEGKYLCTGCGTIRD